MDCDETDPAEAISARSYAGGGYGGVGDDHKVRDTVSAINGTQCRTQYRVVGTFNVAGHGERVYVSCDLIKA